MKPTREALEKAQQEFTEYFVKNYPGPNTIIHNPNWHAPKIFRAVVSALQAQPAQEPFCYAAPTVFHRMKSNDEVLCNLVKSREHCDEDYRPLYTEPDHVAIISAKSDSDHLAEPAETATDTRLQTAKPVAYKVYKVGCRAPDDCEEYFEAVLAEDVSETDIRNGAPLYDHPANELTDDQLWKLVNDIHRLWETDLSRVDALAQTRVLLSAKAGEVKPLVFYSKEYEDLTLEEAIEVSRHGWRKVLGRTEMVLVRQIAKLLKAQSGISSPDRRPNEKDVVAVPVQAYLWLMGLGADGFTQSRRGAFWWRSAFNERAGLDMMSIYESTKPQEGKQ